jgi:tetratricopeptide (TPR) repeat protein
MRWLFSFIFSFGLLQEVKASPTPSTVFENQEGISDLKAGNAQQAQEKFLSSLSTTPLEARLHYNLGLSFEALGQMEKAQASYQTALRLAQDDATRFSANFNLGEMAQKAKKKDEALAYYQEALRYNPESHETKVNIELLTQNKGGGQGQGDDKQDQKDKDGKGQGDQDQDQKDDKKDDQGKDGDKKKDQQPKQYAKNKPQPRKFQSGQLTQGDVNKILGEIKQQEQKIRAEYNKKDVKEQPREKDW